MTITEPVRPTRTQTAIRPFTDRHLGSTSSRTCRAASRDTRWPQRETVDDTSQGVQLEVVEALAAYWDDDYDWHDVEARLNALPQFVTEIDGLDIHFIHVRSPHADALPMIVTHGWPGSVIEQLKIVGPLTDPTAHGADAADAFDLVIPSLPGHGFSGKPDATGWDPIRIAKAWVELMSRLGYDRYVAQGGDWGNAVTEQMALLHASRARSASTPTCRRRFRTRSRQRSTAGEEPPADLSPEERGAWDQLAFFYAHGLAYAQEMGNRPADALRARRLAGRTRGVDARPRRAQLRPDRARVRRADPKASPATTSSTTSTLYWLTNTAVSSARLYWESKLAFFAPKGVTIPVARERLPGRDLRGAAELGDEAYPNLIHFNRLDRGGHFAAWEQPELFSQEMRASFRSLR